MKKILLSATVLVLLFSCQNDATQSEEAISATARRNCASQDVLMEQIKTDPTLALKMNKIEAFTQNAITKSNFRLVNGKIVIPVIVNVLYRTAAENISDSQIASQITILNKDFTASNADFNSVPAEFSGVAAGPNVNGIDITFELAGVVRKVTTKSSWGTRDVMKNAKRGGIDATSPSNTLNIWSCTIGGGILGYAQFPGGSASTDGVVVDPRYFGLSGNANAPYNLGRTATHEVGHWMNLRHIWGDSSCGNDLVSDTPVHRTANYTEVYPFASTCLPAHNEMTMNYMDYSNDNLMYMFTLGQKARMSALFVSGGARAGFRL